MFLLALLLGMGTSSPFQVDRPGPSCCDLYPAASGSLEIRVEAGDALPSLRDVAADYARLTSQTLVIDDATNARLSAGTGGLQTSVTVPAPEVQSFFEEVLAANGFLLHVMRDDAPRAVRILSRDELRGGIVWLSNHVGAEHVAHADDHPATLFTTTLHLPHTDVRQLATSLRALMSDNRTQSIVPAGGSDSVVLTGLGEDLAGFTRLLREVDAASERPPATGTEIVRLQHADARTSSRASSAPPSVPAPSRGRTVAPTRPASWSSPERTRWC